MLHHVSIGVVDVARAASFYDAVLAALGYKRVMDYSPGAIAYGESRDKPEFWVGLPHDQRTPSAGNGTHVSFAAKSKGAVNKFHEEALRAGGSNGGEPGPRPDYGPDYYGAFVYDLDGNKIEATLIEIVRPAAAAKAKRKTAKKPTRKTTKKLTRKTAKKSKTSTKKRKGRR